MNFLEGSLTEGPMENSGRRRVLGSFYAFQQRYTKEQFPFFDTS
jgi:hypothetical protein